MLAAVLAFVLAQRDGTNASLLVGQSRSILSGLTNISIAHAPAPGKPSTSEATGTGPMKHSGEAASTAMKAPAPGSKKVSGDHNDPKREPSARTWSAFARIGRPFIARTRHCRQSMQTLHEKIAGAAAHAKGRAANRGSALHSALHKCGVRCGQALLELRRVLRRKLFGGARRAREVTSDVARCQRDRISSAARRWRDALVWSWIWQHAVLQAPGHVVNHIQAVARRWWGQLVSLLLICWGRSTISWRTFRLRDRAVTRVLRLSAAGRWYDVLQVPTCTK